MRHLRWYFGFFLASGFCTLVYEVVWLRLAMAAFGVTTPLVSLVLSLFMAGLALGSWVAGHLSRRQEGRPASHFLRLYALAELLIGISAFAVPRELAWGRQLLVGASEGAAWGSASYYVASGALISIALLPFCTCMGATFPLAMSAIRRGTGAETPRSFSYLYLANVLGAGLGTLTSAFFLIELFGFHRTLDLTAVLNGLVAAGAFALSLASVSGEAGAIEASRRGSSRLRWRPSGSEMPALLFLTGLASLAMELVWIRQFTPYLGPLVYSFAAVLAVYLAFTALGSKVYRVWVSSRERVEANTGWPPALMAVGVSALMPLLAADPRLPLGSGVLSGVARLILGIAPFCAVLGFLTPLLVDRWAGGDPDLAGRAYAVNVVGCILGPLLAGFWLLPGIGERGTLLALGLPLLALGWLASWRAALRAPTRLRFARRRSGLLAAALAGALLLVFGTREYESRFAERQVRRDYTATVIAAGEGMDRRLLINGVGITSLSPITKMMAHLPAAFLPAPPQSALVICFGMGTSFRSLLSWGAPTAAVELVPSVPSLFGYFHEDGPRLLRSPLGQVIIDDGRRFLERTPRLYDVITIDPPPPVSAAASSLLYSREFYAVVRKRLRSGGIVQQWLPWGEPTVLSAVARALNDAFPHVRVFKSVLGVGFHFLASASPIPTASAGALAARVPPLAAADLLEWGPYDTVEKQFQAVLRREIAVDEVMAVDPTAAALRDDRPVNEYFFLRRMLASPEGRRIIY